MHLALVVGALLHRVERVLLALEDPRRAGEDLLRLAHAGDLHDRALGREVALEPDDAAGRRDRRVDREDHPAVGLAADVVELLADAAAARGHAVAVEQAGAQQLLQHDRHAAGLVEILGDVLPAGLEVDEVGGVAEDVADVLEGELDPRLVRDRRQVQPAVGRAAGAGDDARGVLEALPRDDVAGADVLLEEPHHRDAARGRVLVAALVGRGRAGRVEEREPDRLGDAGHGVGGELAAAGAGGGAGDALEDLERGVAERAGLVPAHRLEHVLHRQVAVGEVLRHRAPAGTRPGRIEPP